MGKACAVCQAAQRHHTALRSLRLRQSWTCTGRGLYPRSSPYASHTSLHSSRTYCPTRTQPAAWPRRGRSQTLLPAEAPTSSYPSCRYAATPTRGQKPRIACRATAAFTARTAFASRLRRESLRSRSTRCPTSLRRNRRDRRRSPTAHDPPRGYRAWRSSERERAQRTCTYVFSLLTMYCIKSQTVSHRLHTELQINKPFALPTLSLSLSHAASGASASAGGGHCIVVVGIVASVAAAALAAPPDPAGVPNSVITA